MNGTLPQAAAPNGGDIIESVIAKGDLSKLTPQERTRYYVEVCKSVGLNPLTKPFEYITLNNKLTLYALRNCTDQLRTIHGVSVEDLTESEREGVFIVTAKVRNKEGRTDVSKGAVTISGLKGDNLANAMMKAETKAKRRATLSICGLGFLDETEIETIPASARGPAPVAQPAIAPPPLPQPPTDPETGEILPPHAIEVPRRDATGLPDWIAYGSRIVAAYNSATSIGDLAEWEAMNIQTLNEMASHAPKAHALVMKRREERRAALTPEPEMLDADEADKVLQ